MTTPTHYSLFNRHNQEWLTHPAVGRWYTLSREEAEGMRNDCLEYLRAANLGEMCEMIEIRDINEKKEIS